MDYVGVGKEYGWTLVLALFLIREIWPWVARFLGKGQETKINQTMAVIQDEQLERAAEREARAQERKFRHDVDERQVKAYEKLADALQTTVQLQATMNERINQVSAGQASLTSFMVESVAHMRETVAGRYSGQGKRRVSGER